MTLELVRIGLDEANAFVSAHHRHHRPVVGHLFSLGAAVAGKIVGVAIVGRPVSRHRDDGETADWRGTGGTLIRFRVRDGEIAITQEGEDAPFVDRIAIRRISDDI